MAAATTDRRFKGRLFGPGLPGAGIDAVAAWEPEGRLRITPADEPGTVYYAEQPAAAGRGFNAESLQLSWRQDGGDWAFVVTDADAQALCTATAPPQLTARLQAVYTHRTRLERRFTAGGVLLALLVLLPLLAIGLFLANRDHVADWVVDRIPVAHEARLGDAVLAQIRLQMKLTDNGPAVDAVSAIGSRLTTGSPYSYRWFVADRPEINAFAAPGGVVVVFSGLIKAAQSAEELAGVLAHEVAHVELRHSLQGLVKGLGLRALASIALGGAADSMLADAATRLTELRFSRDAEREADAHGLLRLVEARISPEGMVRFYQRLAAEKHPAPLALLSTHPASGERLDWLRNEAVKFPGPWQPLQIDLDRIEEISRKP